MSKRFVGENAPFRTGQLLSYGDAGTPGNVSDPVTVGFGGWLDFRFLFSGRNAAGEDRIYTVVAFRLAVPKEPSDLRVTDVGDRRIGLAWQDNSDDESGFKIRFRGKRPDFSDHTGTKSVGQNVVSASLSSLRSNHEYTISVVAVNLDGSSRSSNEVRATTPARQISVSKEGVGSSAVFTVAGTGFSPNSLVIIRATDPQLQQRQFFETAGADGKFTSRNGLSCESGVTLTFTAFEDADPQGTFANAVVTTCP